MKSEEFILQEMEKDRLEKLAAEEGRPVDMEKPVIKFMISGEAPILMSKACELLIKDLTHRAWTHTERNRRRTLQRQDLHAAVGESEVYDFLIDIVPRVTAPSQKVHTNAPPLPSQGIPSGVAGLGGASHPAMAQAGIPPGIQMQMHTGIPAAASMPQGAMASIPEDVAGGMMQHMDPQQVAQAHAQAAQQQQQYHHDPTQHTAGVLHAQHQHQQQVSQHHQAYPRGMQQDGTSPVPPPDQHAEPAAWLPNTATD